MKVLPNLEALRFRIGIGKKVIVTIWAGYETSIILKMFWKDDKNVKTTISVCIVLVNEICNRIFWMKTIKFSIIVKNGLNVVVLDELKLAVEVF